MLVYETKERDGSFWCQDDKTRLRLKIEVDGRGGYEVNGHPFATELLAKAYAETYAQSAAIRHGLSEQKPATGGR